MMDKRFVLLSEKDNVFVCCSAVRAGETVYLEGKDVQVNVDINVGHKIARNNISNNGKIIKYGASIGSAVANIDFGQHIHLHNMKSDYIASHTRQNKVGANQ